VDGRRQIIVDIKWKLITSDNFLINTKGSKVVRPEVIVHLRNLWREQDESPWKEKQGLGCFQK